MFGKVVMSNSGEDFFRNNAFIFLKTILAKLEKGSFAGSGRPFCFALVWKSCAHVWNLEFIWINFLIQDVNAASGNKNVDT